MRDPLAVRDLVDLLRLAADEEQVVAAAAVNGAPAEVGLDDVVATAGRDVVRAVAGVDEVLAVAADDRVDLRGRLAARLVVAPQHVAPRPGIERVVAVPAEQLVV